MKTWFISRHPGALSWIKQQRIHFDEHVSHLDPSIVQAGDKVIGSLPINLAAQICQQGAEYWHLSLVIPAELRGQELTQEQLEQFGATLEKYQIKLNGSQSQLQKVEQQAEQATEQKLESQSKQKKELEKKPEVKALETIEDQEPDTAKINVGLLLSDVFKLHAWGDNRNAQRKLDEGLRLAKELYNERPHLSSQLQARARQGKQAAAFTDELKTIFNKQSLQAAEKYIAEKEQTQCSKRVIQHLRYQLKKQDSYRKNKAKHAKANKYKPYDIQLEYTQLQNGQHPQSLRQLKPRALWNIVIDETGTVFENDFEGVAQKDVGKIIALVMPNNTNLKPLSYSHSTDLSIQSVEELITAVVQSNSGVLGASFDGVLEAHTWMAGIAQFIRLLLVSLPINPEEVTKVQIEIEQRSSYTSNEQLQALTETIESEMRVLSPTTYQNLLLDLNIADKDNPYNGYVDAIANCWGSPSEDKRRLLARTLWRGHCLLQEQLLDDLEQLYLNVSSGDISPSLWFNLCDKAAAEPNTSLLNNLLNELGEQAQLNPTLWQGYLAEAQYRMQRKDYHAGSLGRATTWLQAYKPAEQKLPPLLTLQFESSRLAALNHQGIANQNAALEIISLAENLTDEAPEDACQAVLRAIISATNYFVFNLDTILDTWLAYPIAVPGLLNHAKLHSTQGQILAFQAGSSQSSSSQSSYDQAIESFDTALSFFEQLSDKTAAQREIRQTSVYKACALMDSQHPIAADFTYDLLMAGQSKKSASLENMIKNLAANTDAAYRFDHYLLLRLFITSEDSQELAQHKACYLAEQENWQQGEGHPWMLINAYRAWLLAEQNHLKKAKHYFKLAVDDCVHPENGVILHWMGQVIHALANSMSIQLEPINSSMAIPSHFPQHYLESFKNSALEKQQRLALLNKLLPFNFH